ncbi:hypothetical protein BO79DRAFT_231314 [Aspergillus costaricaensis CBS 115574]|uniref:Uncharacterized protein n=1 Tax=Aspergillus costaricaensis CBS 115574 TaxID=1448317 RepID=A0ACD1I580_9EURO|nr:hypothetical protein BO79DRAFT_231314 [Aspergillus costaricaensis CBS 115574]RAK85657.1 hypothetical protein BO79DRAFT_231314 [Aspergillus costaricaensis CBS 115574]
MNTDKTRVVTVTVGGNYITFADILMQCILRWQPWSITPSYNYFCAHFKQAAQDLMTDTSDKGLQAQLSNIYRDIRGQADSNRISLFLFVEQVYLYVVGYPKLFNAQTTYCNSVNIRYWGVDTANPYTALTTSNAITDANNRRESMNIAYADVDARFEGHRWCEGGVKEPDATYPSTFFFLSGWSDITEEGAIQQASSDDESDYISSLQGQTTLPLPDGHTCNTTLGANPDPVDVYWSLAQMVSRANSEVADGNYTAQDIGWLKPTRQLKTFHPRSAGMALYRDAILDLMQDD